MACCKTEFLKGKAANFRTYIESLQPDDEVRAWLSAFHESMLVPTIHAVLVPMAADGRVKAAVSDLVSKLRVPEGQHDEVRAKIERYLAMFVEVATA